MVNLLLQVCQRREKKFTKETHLSELNSVWLEHRRRGEEGEWFGLVRLLLLLAKATAAVLDQTLMYIADQTCFRIVLFT